MREKVAAGLGPDWAGRSENTQLAISHPASVNIYRDHPNSKRHTSNLLPNPSTESSHRYQVWQIPCKGRRLGDRGQVLFLVPS